MKQLLTALLLIAAGAEAAAQCSNCGQYHGGAPSSGTMNQEADRRREEAGKLMQQYEQRVTERREAAQRQMEEFQKLDAQQREESRKRQEARIREIQGRTGAPPEKLPDPAAEALKAAVAEQKKEELRQRRAAEATKAAEEHAKEHPMTPEERRQLEEKTRIATGREAARDRMKLRDRTKSLAELEAKARNDAPGPETLRPLDPDSIFKGIVTEWEKTKDRMSKIFDDAGAAEDPTK